MIKIEGKYGTAKVYTDKIEDAAYDQIKNLMDDTYAIGSVVRIMPDVHAGADNVIGLTMTITDKISPLLIGSDIGCGVSLSEFKVDKLIDLKQLDDIIREFIPYGPDRRDSRNLQPIHEIGIDRISDNLILQGMRNKVREGIGTLGGGNHFVELYSSGNNRYALAVHTGSRSLGGAVYKHYRSLVIDEERKEYNSNKNKTIRKYKRENRLKELQTELDRLNKEFTSMRSEGRNIRYLEGQDKDDYLHDMALTQEYAFLNRMCINNIIIKLLQINGYEVERISYVDKPHNYVDLDKGILRKGSQSASEGETVLIPINMRDGMIVGKASGNRDWNYSAPHGAGRVMSRKQARKELSIVDFRKDMEGIFTTVVGDQTLDEAPAAYKPIKEISSNILDTVEVLKVLKPIYNFKGGREGGKNIEKL